MSEATGVWYCPVCLPRPLFREVHRGYYIRVGLEEADAATEAEIDPEAKP